MGLSVVQQNAPAEAHSAASTRAAQAAARVAARYAKAPSYSEMQAAEAQAALRAAATATRAALEAQAVAQVALANLQTANLEQEELEQQELDQQELEQQALQQDLEMADSGLSAREIASPRIEDNFSQKAWELEAPSAPVIAPDQPLKIRWDPDLPVRPAETPAAPALSEPEDQEPEGNWWGSATLADASAAHQAIEPVEAAQPIHANLIEFPRELVATRRMRPRLTCPQAAEGGEPDGQLSIFEVDPSTISIDPGATEVVAEAPAPSWSGTDWSTAELEQQLAEEERIDAEIAAEAPELQLAPFGRRLMAAVVDGALIMGVLCGAAAVLADHMQNPPAMKALELASVAALIVVSVLYQILFLTLTDGTPGMRYARIGLCTFDDENPTRAQRCGRLGSLLLSLLPVGLGVAWAIFDEEHLSWHDRLSRTYQRKY
jgi:uncharacterized RDD family membrane protein YckC